MSLNSGRVSSSWKRANVTPVFKAGATDLVENYRSISWLSISTKCQEKIVHSAIHSHVAPFLTDWQQGFVKSRSCATYQLVLTQHQWTKALEDGLQVDVVFLDFAKAFVKVGRAYGHVFTKFSWMGRLPHFLSYGAPSTRASRALGAPLLVDLWRSVFEIGAGRSFVPSQKSPPPQLFLCVNRSPFSYDFRGGAKASGIVWT